MRLQDVATPQLTTRLLSQAKRHGMKGPQAEQYIKNGVIAAYRRAQRQQLPAQYQRIPLPPWPTMTLLHCCGQWHWATASPFTTPCCGRTYILVKDISKDTS